ncbi:MAG: tetratricopeptide repeat protein [Cyanobacteriota bacterium]
MRKLIYVLILASLLNITFDNIPQLKSNSGQAIAKRYYAAVYRYSTKGEQLIEQGKLDQAENYYKGLLRRNRRDQNAKVGLGSVYSAKFQLGAAKKEFEDVLKWNSKHPGAHNGMGLYYYRMTTSSNQEIRNQIPEYYQKAIDEYKTALNFAPNYPEAHNNLGKIYQEQGRLEEAQQEYQKAVDLDPRYGTALVNLGTVYQAKGELDTAADKYKQAIKLNSKDSTAHYHLGDVYQAQGNFNDAIKELQTSLYQNPNSAPVHDKLGEVYEKQGNEAAAINEYRKAINIKPEYTESYLKLSSVFENRGDDEFAIAELRSAINVNPDFTEGKLRVADISTKIGKEDQAIKLYQDILQTDPNNSEALKGIASAYFFKAKKDTVGGIMASPGDYVEAEQALRRAVAANPNDLELHLALLRISDLAGNKELAQNEYNMIASSPAQTPAQSVIRGEALFALNRYKDGEAEFQRALTYTNDSKDILLLGDIFSVNGALPLATAAYSKALSQDPNNVKASKGIDRVKKLDDQSRTDYRAGIAFFKEGQKVAAIDNLRKAAAVNSVQPETRWMLAESFNKEGFYQDALDEYNAYLQLATEATDPKTYKKATKNVSKLTAKLNKMRSNGEQVKVYDQYIQTYRKKY